MINSSSNTSSIRPNPVLDIFRPTRFEEFLTDWARCVSDFGVVGCPDPGFWWGFCGVYSFVDGFVGVGAYFVDCFAGFYPVLEEVKCKLSFKEKEEGKKEDERGGGDVAGKLTFSLRYQHRF